MRWSTVAIAVAAIPVVAVGIMFALGPYGGGPVIIKPGDAVEEDVPLAIEELSIAAKDWRLLAYKWTEAAKDFQISFFRRGQAAPETCRSGDKFQALLSKISTLRAAKVLSEDETRRLIEDNYGQRISVENFMMGRQVFSRWDVYRLKSDRSKLLVVTEDFPRTAFEATWNAGLFDSFAKGCGYFGADAPP